MRKAVIRICNVLSISLLCLIIAVGGTLLVFRLLGYEARTVVSGSMEPKIPTGSLVITDKNAAAEDIQPGDIITFQVSSIYTHKVVSVEEDYFTTQGEANETVDPWEVPFTSVIGRYWFHVPLLGWVLYDLGSAKGVATAAGMAAVVIILFVIPYILKKNPDKAGPPEKDKAPKD